MYICVYYGAIEVLGMAQEAKPKKKRIRNPVETRAKLLKATMELVAENGVAALSLKEAARRAKVSRGVAYLHFEDRGQLLEEARTWIAEGLQEGLKQFDRSASLHDKTFYTTKLVLDHPDASKLLITDLLSGSEINREHSLYKFVLYMLKELKASGKAHADMDAEIMTYIMLGSIAATVMLGVQRQGEDVNGLAERFANEWNRVMQQGFFKDTALGDAGSGRPRREARGSSKAAVPVRTKAD
jgi:AcrR family transcriptional regulator